MSDNWVVDFYNQEPIVQAVEIYEDNGRDWNELEKIVSPHRITLFRTIIALYLEGLRASQIVDILKAATED